MIMPENIRIYSIYKITNKTNGKVYIGQTAATIKRRMGRHINDSYSPRCAIHRAIKKHGVLSFVCEAIHEGLSKEEANKKEMELIRQFNSKLPTLGYNMTDGGDGANGLKQSEETRAKKSKKLKGHKPWITGLHHAEEVKKKLSEVMKRRVLSEESKARISAAVSAANSIRVASAETRAKISAANKGHRAWNLGKPISEETKAKISVANKGKKLNEETKARIGRSMIGNNMGFRRKHFINFHTTSNIPV
jgi:group I intron endonuclease